VAEATVNSAEALDHYEREGYHIFRGVLDAELVAEIDEHIGWLQQHHPDGRPEFLDHAPVADDPFWARLVGDDRLLDIVELFIGPDIALYASQYIVKPPFTGQQVLLHQDASYWPLEPMEVVSLWVAGDHVDAENGCMRVVPGTHKMSTQELRIRTDVENVLSSEIAVDIDDSEAVDIVVAPGDVEVHHPNMVHGSHANTSSRRRAGLTIRYIPTTTKLLDPNWKTSLLLRGDEVPGLNRYVARPRYVEGYHMPFRGCENWV
jgi:ectoine hydroxylase-related dioxygenase (phytanoyl-CoA dioxygenase family)